MTENSDDVRGRENTYRQIPVDKMLLERMSLLRFFDSNFGPRSYCTLPTYAWVLKQRLNATLFSVAIFYSHSSHPVAIRYGQNCQIDDMFVIDLMGLQLVKCDRLEDVEGSL